MKNTELYRKGVYKTRTCVVKSKEITIAIELLKFHFDINTNFFKKTYL